MHSHGHTLLSVYVSKVFLDDHASTKSMVFSSEFHGNIEDDILKTVFERDGFCFLTAVALVVDCNANSKSMKENGEEIE